MIKVHEIPAITIIYCDKTTQKSKTKSIILAGGFNLPHIDWDNNTVKPGANLIYQNQELLDIKDEFNLEQLQLNPSRCYSASSLKQQSVSRHVAPLEHILIPSQPVKFVLTL
jgi:hypothetical protein